MRNPIVQRYNEKEREHEEYHQVLQTELQFRAFQIKEVSRKIEKLIQEDEGKEKEQK